MLKILIIFLRNSSDNINGCLMGDSSRRTTVLTSFLSDVMRCSREDKVKYQDIRNELETCLEGPQISETSM